MPPSSVPATLVLGYVPTPTGYSALREARREAVARDARLVVVNFVGPQGYAQATAADEKQRDAVLARLRAAGVRCDLRQVTDESTPAKAILKVAGEVNATLILLGAHQRSWFARQLLGSTAQSVVLHAKCPVLIVPDLDDHESGWFGDGTDLPTPGMQ